MKSENEGSPRFEYIPLSETEQDAISRMVEDQDLMVEVEGWGYHPNPEITYGDKRIQIQFPIEFDRPEGIEVPVSYFDLKLKRRDGEVLVESRESTYYKNEPLRVTSGVIIDLKWDLMIDEIPKDIRDTVLPKVEGEKIASIDGEELIKHNSGDSDGN